MKEAIKRAYDFVKAQQGALGVGAQLNTKDYHVQLVDLLNRKEGSEIGVAFFIALYSVLTKNPPYPALSCWGT